MPPQLVALNDGSNILIDKPIILIGRCQECDIQIPSRKISRRHCCIAQVDDHLVVRDLGSTNGVRVNGVRVPEGILRTGDELIIGNCRYEVRLTSDPSEPLRSVPQSKAVSSPEDSGEEPIPLIEPED